MPSWTELLGEIEKLPNEEKGIWLKENQQKSLSEISRLRENRNVIFYGSAFLQKPQLPPPNISITPEEINGFMSVMHGMDWSKGLTLILHTPGGETNATETIVSYLHSKFDFMEVIVPTFAMSAGTMISLSAHKIIMGRQSQLGPIDPQMFIGGRFLSARALVDQFERARKELSKDIQYAHLWAPILQAIGPAALQEAQNALDYGQRMVKEWLKTRMFVHEKNAARMAGKAELILTKPKCTKVMGDELAVMRQELKKS